MMVLSGSMYSATLGGKTHLTVLLPSDSQDYGDGQPKALKGPYRTLYLLHGMGGDDSDWITHTSLSHLAKRCGICVVLPSCLSSFYEGKWGEYVGRELVEVTRRAFPLSSKQKDTWIMGASMGGWGALHLAASYPGTFGRCIALSTAAMGRPLPFPRCPLYLGCGSEDALLAENKELACLLGSELHVSKGGHDWTYWNSALNSLLQPAS